MGATQDEVRVKGSGHNGAPGSSANPPIRDCPAIPPPPMAGHGEWTVAERKSGVGFSRELWWQTFLRRREFDYVSRSAIGGAGLLGVVRPIRTSTKHVAPTNWFTTLIDRKDPSMSRGLIFYGSLCIEAHLYETCFVIDWLLLEGLNDPRTSLRTKAKLLLAQEYHREGFFDIDVFSFDYVYLTEPDDNPIFIELCTRLLNSPILLGDRIPSATMIEISPQLEPIETQRAELKALYPERGFETGLSTAGTRELLHSIIEMFRQAVAKPIEFSKGNQELRRQGFQQIALIEQKLAKEFSSPESTSL
jgi:hypothetical protein